MISLTQTPRTLKKPNRVINKHKKPYYKHIPFNPSNSFMVELHLFKDC